MELLKYIRDNLIPTIVKIGSNNNGTLYTPDGQEIPITIHGLGSHTVTPTGHYDTDITGTMPDRPSLATGNIVSGLTYHASTPTTGVLSADALRSENLVTSSRPISYNSISTLTTSALRSTTDVMREQIRDEMSELRESIMNEVREELLTAITPFIGQQNTQQLRDSFINSIQETLTPPPESIEEIPNGNT